MEYWEEIEDSLKNCRLRITSGQDLHDAVLASKGSFFQALTSIDGLGETVRVHFDYEYENGTCLGAPQILAFDHFRDSYKSLRGSIVEVLLNKYTKERKEAIDSEAGNPGAQVIRNYLAESMGIPVLEEMFPNFETTEEMWSHLHVPTIELLKMEKNGMGYLRLMFIPTWTVDDLWVVLHQDRIFADPPWAAALR